MEKRTDLEPVKLLTRAQLASLREVSPKTLANWHSAGTGPPAVELRGGLLRYQVRAVMAWSQANKKDAA
ncbi:DNA-binding protein [Arthrobacter sp. GCM10027362]|uniref:DNA-binding protein n=1 Tax=Arthrobacter sp. GCM10027362 TaxID=3273379 RepID=UPI00362C6F49